MKLNNSSRQKLAADLRSSAKTSGLSYAEIGKASQVHSSQVSRICRGNFKTLSHNVVEVCKALGLETEVVKLAEPPKDQNARKLARCVLKVWDKSPEDAKRIERFLRDLAQLRNPPSV